MTTKQIYQIYRRVFERA